MFVRIRPGVTAGAPRWDTENCIHATSRYSIAIAPPEGSQAYKSGDRGQTYSFTRVFDEHTVQTEYYEATAAPLVGRLGRHRATLPREMHCHPTFCLHGQRPAFTAPAPITITTLRTSAVACRYVTCCAMRGTTV